MSTSQPRTTNTTPGPRFAILDDYQSIAPAKFTSLTTSHNLQVSSYPSTLDPRQPSERDALIARLKPYSIISAMRERTPLRADVLEHLPNLKLIMTTGGRNAAIDLETCKARGITVTGTSGYGKPATDASDGNAETYAGPPQPAPPNSTTTHTWALILALTRHIPRDHTGLTASDSAEAWQGPTLATGLGSKTLSILGYGRLGAEVARIAWLCFGMRVIAWSSSLTQAKADEKSATLGLPAGAVRAVASKEEAIQQADVLSLHYVLSERSRGIIGAKELAMMKKTAVLVNTSRGPLVDEDALLAVLKRGGIAGVAVDVFETEPLPASSEWRSVRWGAEGRSEVVLSPHMGYGEDGIMGAWYEEQADILRKWLDGGEVGPMLGGYSA